MKRSVAISLLALVMLIAAPAVSHAQHRGGGGGHGGPHGGFHGGDFHHGGGGFRGEVFIGPGWWGWPYPYWYGGWYPPPYYGYGGYGYGPPSYAPDEPQSYVEQEPEPEPPPPQSFWYYCRASRAYYPNVRECAQGWVKVPARPPAN